MWVCIPLHARPNAGTPFNRAFAVGALIHAFIRPFYNYTFPLQFFKEKKRGSADGCTVLSGLYKCKFRDMISLKELFFFIFLSENIF